MIPSPGSRGSVSQTGCADSQFKRGEQIRVAVGRAHELCVGSLPLLSYSRLPIRSLGPASAILAFAKIFKSQWRIRQSPTYGNFEIFAVVARARFSLRLLAHGPRRTAWQQHAGAALAARVFVAARPRSARRRRHLVTTTASRGLGFSVVTRLSTHPWNENCRTALCGDGNVPK